MTKGNTLDFHVLDDGQIEGAGNIADMDIEFPFIVRPAESRYTKDSPTHEVFYKRSSGTEVQIGIAWQGERQKDDEHKGAINMGIVFTSRAIPEHHARKSCHPTTPDNSGPLRIIAYEKKEQREIEGKNPFEGGQLFDDEIPH